MSTVVGSLPSPARRRERSRGALLDRIRQYLPAIVVAIVALAIWEVATAGSGRRVVPPPSAIVGAIGDETELLRRSTLATFSSALGGLLYGTLAGVVVAFLTARWSTARAILMPIAIASSAIPLIAIAPIINNWFGVLNPASKQIMAALLVFFPVTINVTRGLVEVPPAALELMRSYASTELQVLRKVRIPNTLPFFFTALKVGTTLAFIGAIVGEFFGGTSEVLGRVVLQSISRGSFDVAWAGILLGAVGAIVSYLAVSIVERLVIPWYAASVAGSA